MTSTHLSCFMCVGVIYPDWMVKGEPQRLLQFSRISRETQISRERENLLFSPTLVLEFFSDCKMHPRKLLVILCLTAASVAYAGGHNGSHAEYIGGTRPDIPANNSGEIEVADRIYFVFHSKHTQVKIPFERINLLEYGQKVNRRYLAAAVISPLFMLAKKREHFLTVGFQGDDGQQEAMVFKVDKNDIRLALVTLEARTGQAIQYQDDEARLAGKG